jgi:putative flippase GtrA
MTAKTLKQIAKFITVGVINTGIDIAVLKVLILLTGLGRQGFYFTFFKAISFVVAVINSYFMNKYWAFAGAKKSKTSVEMTQFFIVSLGGLVVNAGAATIFLHSFDPILNTPLVVNNWPLVAALFGSGVGLFWNYIGYKKIVFKHHHPDLYPPA